LIFLVDSALKLSPLVFQVQEKLADVPDVYLVGGAVRDALLGIPSHDLDFVVLGDSLGAARKLADELGGAYYCMDEDFKVGRVVLGAVDQKRTAMDFTAMQGGSLEEDLRKRDFTVNAMALNLFNLERVIDPLGGAVDLLQARLNICAPTSFEDDPVRVLRALRIAASYQLTIQPETAAALKASIHLLPKVSVERLRDELFKILDGPQPAANLRVMERLGILEFLLPECSPMKGVTQSAPHIFDVWDHSLHTVKRLGDILRLLDKNYAHDNEEGGDLVSGMLSLRLGRYREQISEHFGTRLNPDRSLQAIFLLGGLYHDIAKPSHREVEESGRVRFFGHDASGAQVVRQRASALRLSSAEAQRLETIVREHMRPFHLFQTGKAPSRRAVYRFWRAAGDAGVEVCLLSIADLLAIYGHTLPQETLEQHLDVVRTLLEAFWEKPEDVKPQALLNGSDLMEMFDLKPGPQIGELLESLWEAQAVGEVKNEGQAVRFIRLQLNQ
jgi:putative nucleotidyltransferase with HDIG domain